MIHKDSGSSTAPCSSDDDDDVPDRLTGPRYLCFVDTGDETTPVCRTWKVSDYVAQYGHDASTEFVFLSYTRKQFYAPTDSELESDYVAPSEVADKREMAERYRSVLLDYGARAARAASRPAFWVDFACVQQDDPLLSANDDIEDVWRICDVVRAAHSLAIVTGPSLGNKMQNANESSKLAWLQEWATRLWTLPEILLSSTEHRITVYAVGDPGRPRTLAKRNFAAQACPDARAVQQLVDHYESSIHLTPLELISIALECLQRRQTARRNAGDVSYALQGLLRRRPKVDKTDSSFEAFARLSLSNDSDMLLERVLCMLPANRDAAWHDFHDAWGARLWDIEPSCQIAGVVDDNKVTVDGAFAASIHWDSLESVAFLKRETMVRSMAKFILRTIAAWLALALALVIGSVVAWLGEYPNANLRRLAFSGGQYTIMLWIGVIILGISSLIILCTPAMILNLYKGTFRSTQVSKASYRTPFFERPPVLLHRAGMDMKF